MAAMPKLTAAPLADPNAPVPPPSRSAVPSAPRGAPAQPRVGLVGVGAGAKALNPNAPRVSAPAPGAIAPPAPPVAVPAVIAPPPPAPAAVIPPRPPAVIAPPAPPAVRPPGGATPPAGVVAPPAPPAVRSAPPSVNMARPPAAGAPPIPGAAPAFPGRPAPAGAASVIAPPPPPAETAAPAAPAVPLRKSPVPETGAVETIDATQAAALKLIADGLDTQDYFQVLQLAQTANPGDIKKAFYRESRIYHPDRFFHLPPGDIKTSLNDIYKRITEAYHALRDDSKRKKYVSDIQGPDRANKLRYTEASESELKAEAKKAVEEEYGTNPKSRGFYKSALKDLEAQNWGAAERNLKSALTFEPSNAKFKEKLAEVQKKLEAQRKAGPSYMIK